MHKLRIIDALGPFVELPDSAKTINWSKVHFADLEQDGRLPSSTSERIVERFERYVKKVATLGYDSLSMDDLAHLVSLPSYSQPLQNLLDDYRTLYRQLFTIAKQHQLRVFINTDFMFYHPDIQAYMTEHKSGTQELFVTLLGQLFENYPEVDGLILRIGENDGKDVAGTFLSRLELTTPAEVNTLLQAVLPLFEARKKLLIFRTWTVGAHPIGDLIWNEETYNQALGTVQSDVLIVSMKYGDTDFMRYLRLNPLLLRTPHQKVIELQTRREWEGMGTYPSFVGWDYQDYLDQLKDDASIVGIHVWCQTGGWANANWNNVTFLQNSSFWNELNTFVTGHMFLYECTAEEAVRAFCKQYKITDATKFIALLRLSDTVIHQGLYFRELAATSRYFRRARIPTLLWLTWDRAFTGVVPLLRALVTRPEAAVNETRAAADAVGQMIILAKELKLPAGVLQSLYFEQASIRLFVELKAYLLGLKYQTDVSLLQKQVDVYATAFPEHYIIPALKPLKAGSSPLLRGVLGLLLRRTPTYRGLDRLLLATSPLQRRIVRYYLRKTGSHLADQSMGLEVLFL